MEMTEAAKEARREYKRRWNARNKDKQKEYQARFWERKAAVKRQETAKSGKDRRQDAV